MGIIGLLIAAGLGSVVGFLACAVMVAGADADERQSRGINGERYTSRRWTR